MKKQTKRQSESRKRTSAGKGVSLIPLEPFRLPGDAEPPPAKPCSVEELFAGEFAKHLHAMMMPEIGGEQFSDERRTAESILAASAAMRELWNWLALHAANGNLVAQGEVFESALGFAQSFLAGARMKLPGIVNRAKGANAIPGLISRDADWQAGMSKLCREIGQGEVFPFPLEPPGAKGKKQKAKLTTAQHDLVNRLFGYIERFRQLSQWHPFCSPAEIEKQKAEGYVVAPLLEAMLALPPLTPATAKQWNQIGRRVIEEHTKTNPAQHPAFQPDGFFASLGSLDKRGEPALWKRLAEAWELRAEGMTALPVSSPHRQ